MTSRLCSSRERWRQRSKSTRLQVQGGALLCCIVAALALAPSGEAANDAPGWMHSLVSVPLPSYDEKTSAVILYAEDVLAVQANGKIKKIKRRAYKILRPDGRRLGKQHFFYDAETKISGIHGWCIPVAGKDFEVKEKDMTDTGYLDVE